MTMFRIIPCYYYKSESMVRPIHCISEPATLWSMAPTTCFSLCICLLLLPLLGHGSMAELQPERVKKLRQSSRLGQAAASSGGCDFASDILKPIDPIRTLKSEAGTIDYFDEAEQQLLCVGAYLLRVVITYRGLMLPRYANGAILAFAVQGKGIVGWTYPGCPERYQSFGKGDVVALSPGVPYWFYNDNDDSDAPLEFVMYHDISRNSNSIERRHKDFTLAGSNSAGSSNIFNGFTFRSLSRSLGISPALTLKLQGHGKYSIGTIVLVPNGLQLNPSTTTTPGTMQIHDGEHEAGQQQQQNIIRQYYQRDGESHHSPGNNNNNNNNDNPMCSVKVVMNLEDPHSQKNITTHLTGHDFPILNSLGLSIERGFLKPKARVSPVYTMNTHTIGYVTQGSARLQTVDDLGDAVFFGKFRQGQVMVTPQEYALLSEAGRYGFEYIAFKTNADPLVNHIAGPGSVLRGLPVGVIAAAYNVSMEDAVKIKNSRFFS